MSQHDTLLNTHRPPPSNGGLVVVIGGGRVAARKAVAALATHASVLVVAPALSSELRALWAAGKVDWKPASWVTRDLEGIDIVLAHTAGGRHS